jgi:hypothetical protein
MPSPPFGVGFRHPYADAIAAAPRAVDWFEVITDNLLGVGGLRRAALARLRADHAIVLHGLSLSIAGSEPLCREYLEGLRELAEWVEPVWVSDHLCWTSLRGHHAHDLLPLAYTAAVLDHVAARVAHVQEFLGRRLLLENPSAYVAFRADEMDEAEFFAALSRRTGCGLLLDVNNLVVNAANLGIDPTRYLAALPDGIVGYFHLAGHAVLPDVRIDTHDADVPEPVWALFEAAVRRFPAAGIIVERDDRLPPFERLLNEVACARTHHAAALAAVPRPCFENPVLPPASSPTGAEDTVSAVSPPDWDALQNGFWQRLVDQPAGTDHSRDPGLGVLLDDERPVRAARGMRVYSDAYGVNLRRALATHFPALAHVLNADDFAALSAAYVRHDPPRGHDFRRLGAQLPAFIRSYQFAGEYGVAPGALADLAALEQAQIEVLDEPDEPALAPAALGTLRAARWQRVRFAFAQAMRLVRCKHDVLPAVEAVARGERPERPAAAPVTYLVYRADGVVHTERLATTDAAVLEALAAGHSFGVACAGTLDDAQHAMATARLILTLCARALIVAARVDDPWLPISEPPAHPADQIGCGRH